MPSGRRTSAARGGNGFKGSSVAENPAYIAIWPRGFAKSTLAELAVVYLGARGSQKNSKQHTELEADWKLWLYTLFPEHLSDGDKPIPMAPYHEEFFGWVSQLPPKNYTIYVSDTQEQGGAARREHRLPPDQPYIRQVVSPHGRLR